MTPEHEKQIETFLENAKAIPENFRSDTIEAIKAMHEENKRLREALRYVLDEDNGSWEHRKLIGQMTIQQALGKD